MRNYPTCTWFSGRIASLFQEQLVISNCSVLFLVVSVVTIYATLGDEALVYGFNEAECRLVFTDASLLPKLKTLLPQMNHITNIVYFGEAKKTLLEEFPQHVALYALPQVMELGSKLRYCEYCVLILQN